MGCARQRHGPLPPHVARAEARKRVRGEALVLHHDPDVVADHRREEGDLSIPVTTGAQYRFGGVVSKLPDFLSSKHLEDIARFQHGDLYKRSLVDDLRRAQVLADRAAALCWLGNQAAFEVAKANLARTKPLAQQNALSQKDLDDAQGQYEQAAAAVAQSKAQLETAQLDLSYTTIVSPVDGVSSFAAVADGTYVNPQNSQLTTVSVLTPMWINFSVSENEMERVRDAGADLVPAQPAHDQRIGHILGHGEVGQAGGARLGGPQPRLPAVRGALRAAVHRDHRGRLQPPRGGCGQDRGAGARPDQPFAERGSLAQPNFILTCRSIHGPRETSRPAPPRQAARA